MKLTVKELKERINQNRIVEKTTVGELKKKLNEANKFGLGQGFKREEDTVYEIEDLDEYKDKQVSKKVSKDNTKASRKVEGNGSMMLGQGFKINEQFLSKLTESEIIDLVENIVSQLKEDNEYKNLKFVDRISESYHLNEGHVNRIKTIIMSEDSVSSAKKLHNYLIECGCGYAKNKFGGYAGLNEPSDQMIPQIKRTFNTNRSTYPAKKAIMVTADDLSVPMEMVEEMYNMQKEAYKMKNEGGQYGDINERLKETYHKYKKLSEGDMDEMYNEMAYMMEYPKVDEYGDMEEDISMPAKRSKRTASPVVSRSKSMDNDNYMDSGDNIDLDLPEPIDYDQSDDDKEEVNLYFDFDDDEDDEQQSAEFYGGFDDIYTEMNELMKEITGEVEDNEIYADGSYYKVDKIDDNTFKITEEGWGEEFYVTYINGEIEGAAENQVPAEVRQYIINMAQADLVEPPIDEELDPVGQDDGDVNNDGKQDEQDTYLLNRRKAIKKSKLKKR